MSFASFEKSIVSPDLREIARHWREARGNERFPAWEDIRPSAIARQLPIVWSYTYDPKIGDFVGKLGGQAITKLIGHNLKGVRMSALTRIADRQKLFERAKRVMDTQVLFRGRGLMFKETDQYCEGERIVLPLAADRKRADAVIGATDYRMASSFTSNLDAVEEVENWFVLE